MQGAGHRVAITGYGVVAPCGIGKELFWQGLLGPGFTGATSIEFNEWVPSPYFELSKQFWELALAGCAHLKVK